MAEELQPGTRVTIPPLGIGGLAEGTRVSIPPVGERTPGSLPPLSKEEFDAARRQALEAAPEGMSESQFEAYMKQAIRFAEQAKTRAPSGAKTEDWVDWLPAVGGTAFSLAGGSKASPIGIGLAGLGGGAGEAGRQLIRAVQGRHEEVPETAGGRLSAIGGAMLGQAGGEGIGRGVGAAVLKPVGKTLYGLALRPSTALMHEAGGGRPFTGLRRIVGQGFEDAVLPSGLGTGRAGDLVKQSAREATEMARASPTQVDLRRVTHPTIADQYTRMGGELREAGIPPDPTRVLNTMQTLEQVHTPSGGTVPNVNMDTLLQMRRGAEDIADPAFAQARKLFGPPVRPGSEASIAKSQAGSVRDVLEDVLGPRFKDINQRTQARAIVQKAVETAASRPNMLTNLMAGGVALGSGVGTGDVGQAAKNALIFRAMMSPSVLGAMGLGLGKAPYGALMQAFGPELTEQLNALMDQEITTGPSISGVTP